VAEQVRLAVLAAYDRMLGLDLDHLAVDGCITKAPCGGQTAGRSPVDRGKQGLKRSIVTEAAGIPLGAVPAGANPRDDGLRTNFHRQDLRYERAATGSTRRAGRRWLGPFQEEPQRGRADVFWSRSGQLAGAQTGVDQRIQRLDLA